MDLVKNFSRSMLADLTRQLRSDGAIRSDIVERAMNTVDRKHFCRPDFRSGQTPYLDRPLPIGNNVTISAPHMHAMMCEALLPQLTKPGGARVMDIGSGSGVFLAYCAAMMNEQDREQSKFVGIEYVPAIFQFGIENLKSLPMTASLIETGKMMLMQGDGHKGFPELAPYDAIHVGAAAAELPQNLVQQLAPGGRMVIPVGPDGGTQYLLYVDKDKSGKASVQRATAVSFVPLVKSQSQQMN